MPSYSGRRLTITPGFVEEEVNAAISPLPGLGCLQLQSFWVLTNRSWETIKGPLGCRPFKIFGWNPRTQDFTLCLFDGSFSDLESYVEFRPEDDAILLYQEHPDARVCYVYQPRFLEGSTYPNHYEVKVLLTVDGHTWDLVAEGEYR